MGFTYFTYLSLGVIQRVAFSPLAGVGSSASTSVSNASLVYNTKTVWDKPTIFSPSCRIPKKPSNDVLGDVVTHNLDLLPEGQRDESRPFR